MATEAAIYSTRVNTNTVGEEETFSDESIGFLVDSLGSIEAASASIWRMKAASAAELVDVSEAGSTRKFSDLHKNALTMATLWDRKVPGFLDSTKKRSKVHLIVRTGT